MSEVVTENFINDYGVRMLRTDAPRAVLDEKGRCCGRKPQVYKSDHGCMYCGRCDRYYDPGTKAQIENWAWKATPGIPHWFRREQAVMDDAGKPIIDDPVRQARYLRRLKELSGHNPSIVDERLMELEETK